MGRQARPAPKPSPRRLRSARRATRVMPSGRVVPVAAGARGDQRERGRARDDRGAPRHEKPAPAPRTEAPAAHAAAKKEPHAEAAREGRCRLLRGRLLRPRPGLPAAPGPHPERRGDLGRGPGLSRPDYEVEYDNRARVPEHPEIIAGWERDAAAYRAARREHCELGLRYGDHPRQTIDLFLPDEPSSGRPLIVFIHGGYWRTWAPPLFSHFARGHEQARLCRRPPRLPALSRGLGRRHHRRCPRRGALPLPPLRARHGRGRALGRRSSCCGGCGDRLARTRRTARYPPPRSRDFRPL